MLIKIKLSLIILLNTFLIESITAQEKNHFPDIPNMENEILSPSEMMLEAKENESDVETNGYIAENEKGERVIIDNLDDINCAFYLNKVDGDTEGSNITMRSNIGEVILNCD